MKTYTNQEVADYYDLTEVHYKRGWDLNESLAMHYGYWDESVRSFRASLLKMNAVLADYAEIQPGMKVLDAGCGVGGTSIFLAREYDCDVTGIGLSERQIQTCRDRAKLAQVESSTSFQVADFCDPPFEDDSFDRVIFLESGVYVMDKSRLLKEIKRILKPGGKIVFAEYLKSAQLASSDEKLLYKWVNAWAMTDLNTKGEMEYFTTRSDFNKIEFEEITDRIRKSSWRMHYGSWFLAVLSFLYKLYNPKVSDMADKHYQSLFYQYRALRRGLWKYYLIKLS